MSKPAVFDAILAALKSFVDHPPQCACSVKERLSGHKVDCNLGFQLEQAEAAIAMVDDDPNPFHARGRCEDFPCCGHQLGECPTGEPRICPDCGRSFEPTSMNTEFCLACGSRPRLPKFEYGPMNKTGACQSNECAKYYRRRGEPVPTDTPLFWAKGFGPREENICEGCVDDVGSAIAEAADDIRNGDWGR